jgi:hypothetical protein
VGESIKRGAGIRKRDKTLRVFVPRKPIPDVENFNAPIIARDGELRDNFIGYRERCIHIMCASYRNTPIR